PRALQAPKRGRCGGPARRRRPRRVRPVWAAVPAAGHKGGVGCSFVDHLDLLGKCSRPRRKSMGRRRVVITGLGVITSLGEIADEVWDKLCAGTSGIHSIKRWDTSNYPVKIGGECLGFDITNYGV